MKPVILGLAALLALGATGASAQGIRIGPDGVRIDDGRDNVRREYRDERRMRRDRDRDLTTGTVGRRGCREVTIRERDDDGSLVTRTRRECR